VTFLLDNILLIAAALVSGGLLLWPLLSKGGGSSALGTLEATQLINHRNAIIVDVRDEAEFAAGSLAGARNIPFAQLAERIGELARFKSRPVLVVCASGQQSARALATFKAQGFDEAYALAGGVNAWKATLPLVVPGRDNTRAAQNPRGAPKEQSRKSKNEQRARMAKNQPTPVPPEAAIVESAVEPAGAVGQSTVPLAEVIAATDESTSAKA
jgi:rhodanese-related sulfurtransferase